MLKLQELKRSLFGPNPKEITRFCGVATFVQRLKRQYLFIKWPWNVFRLYLSCFNGSVGRNCSSSCLPQGAHMPKGLETKLEFLFIITWIFRLLLKISVEANFCECDLYFWRLCSQQSYTGMSKAEWIWLSYNKQWKDMQLVIFCICSLCSPRVTPSYLFNNMDRQSFLAHDGIQTLDMLSLGFGPNKDRFSA